MNWKCFLGFHKFKKIVHPYLYERDYEMKSKKFVRFIDEVFVCQRKGCHVTKIKTYSFDFHDIIMEKNYKEPKDEGNSSSSSNANIRK